MKPRQPLRAGEGKKKSEILGGDVDTIQSNIFKITAGRLPTNFRQGERRVEISVLPSSGILPELSWFDAERMRRFWKIACLFQVCGARWGSEGRCGGVAKKGGAGRVGRELWGPKG